MFFTYFILASFTVASAVANFHFHSPNPHAFGKRQEYQPTTHTCGPGADCKESCGPEYLLCSDPDTFFCYAPSLQQTCCEGGSVDSWSCPNGDYCLIDGWCCPQGLNPQECALSLSITLPATFVAPTATPSLSNMTTAIATPTSNSTALPEFTGAASQNTFAGGSGLLYTVLLLVGNLF